MVHLTSRDAGLVMAIVSMVALPSCQGPSLAGGQRWFETDQYSAVPIEYSAAPIHGRVVDATTGQPLSGVAVAVTWDLIGGPTGAHVRWLMLAETVTDEKGEYDFPAWGPVRRPRNTALLAEQPWLLLFKAGYMPTRRGNEHGGTGSVRMSYWHGRDLPTRPVVGSEKEYWTQLHVFESALTWQFFRSCDWEKLPHLLRVVLDESDHVLGVGSLRASWTADAKAHSCRPLTDVLG